MDDKKLSSIIAKFSAKFINEAENKRNVVYSPLSAEILLALLSLGATGSAHEELLTILRFTHDEEIRASFSSLSSKLQSMKGVKLEVANKVFIRQGPYEIQSQLKQDAEDVFRASIDKEDFDDRVGTAQKINEWVNSKTNDKIKNVLSPAALHDDTCMILVNAIYFKGNWNTPFKESDTSVQPFHIDVNMTIDIPMMYKRYSLYKTRYSQKLNAELLELPYEGNESRMVIVIPQEIDGLDGILTKIANDYDIMDDVERLSDNAIDVTIPKFKIETEIDLTDVLKKLGITSIFNKSTAGLDKILNDEAPLFVSNALQKAYIEVNEAGTEAAGVTVYLPTVFSNPPLFKADRPFLYLLFGPESTLLFIGVFRGYDTMPKKKKNKARAWKSRVDFRGCNVL